MSKNPNQNKRTVSTRLSSDSCLEKVYLFEKANVGAPTGELYRTGKHSFELETELGTKLETKQYKFSFSLKEKMSPGKSHTRIDSLTLQENEKIHNKDYKIAYEFLIPVMVKIEIQYLNRLKFEKNTSNSETIEIDLSEEVSFLPEKISKNEMIHIVNYLYKKEGKILMKTSLLKKLKEFNTEWNEGIRQSKKEKFFQDLLKRYPIILSLVFPRFRKQEDLNIEYKIVTDNEEKDNNADIKGDDIDGQFIVIELKRPSTKIFAAKKNARNNMEGISSDIVSAMIQLALYCQRLTKSTKSTSFAHGILIFGNSDDIDSDVERNRTWKLLKENYKYEIWTFSEIYLCI